MAYLLNHLLRGVWLLQKQFDSGCKQLQLHHGGLLLKALEKAVQQLVCLVDALRVLSDDPNHRRLRIWLVQVLQILA